MMMRSRGSFAPRRGLSPVVGPSLMPYGDQDASLAKRLLVPETLPGQGEFRNTNVIFWGRRGKGKTLSMVGISKILSPGFKRLGWRIQSNINITFADRCHPLLGSFIASDMDLATRSLLDIDELTELVPSRRAMAKANLNSSSLMVQIRKLYCEVMATTQFPTNVDRQMLQQLDLYVLCDAHIPKNARYNRLAAMQSYIRLYVFDLHGQFTGNFEASKYWPPPLSLAIKTITLRNLPGAWNDYNSFQRVVSEHANENTKSKMIRRQWDTDMIEDMEDEAAEDDMPDDYREFVIATEARFKEASPAALASDGDLHLSLTPLSMGAWLRNKRVAGRFAVTMGTLREAQTYQPDIQKLDGLVRLLEDNGFGVERQGGHYYAEVIR